MTALTRIGSQFVAALPDGYDERTRICSVYGGGIAVTHPEHEPLFITPDGKVTKLVDCDASLLGDVTITL